MQAVGFWLMVITAAFFLGWKMLKKIVARFGHPKFVCNWENGVRVVAGWDNFVTARKQNSGSRYVVVPDCLVFYENDSQSWADKTCMAGSWSLFTELVPYHEWEYEESLFVPYVSRCHMGLEEQKNIFRSYTAKEVREYLGLHEQAFTRKAWNKVINFYSRRDDWNVSAFLVLLFILSFIIWGLAWESGLRSQHRWKATMNASVINPEAITIISKSPIAVTDSDFCDTLVRTTVAEEPIYMGGGMLSVECIDKGGRIHAVRAAVSMNIKKGDKIIARQGRVMLNKNAPEGLRYEIEIWAITEAEALALIASGKFQFSR